jgi:hypothetical protein
MSSEREALELVHHHPGRLRLRAPAFCDSDAEARRARGAVEALPGILCVEHNPETGSLLVEYDVGVTEPDAVIAVVARATNLAPPLDPEEVQRRRRRPALIAIDVARELDAFTSELTGHRADLRTVAPAGMAALAVYAFASSGQRLPRWDNLLYWAFNVFTMLHRRDIDETDAVRFKRQP